MSLRLLDLLVISCRYGSWSISDVHRWQFWWQDRRWSGTVYHTSGTAYHVSGTPYFVSRTAYFVSRTPYFVSGTPYLVSRTYLVTRRPYVVSRRRTSYEQRRTLYQIFRILYQKRRTLYQNRRIWPQERSNGAPGRGDCVDERDVEIVVKKGIHYFIAPTGQNRWNMDLRTRILIARIRPEHYHHPQLYQTLKRELNIDSRK